MNVRYVRLSPHWERYAEQIRYDMAHAAAWDAGNASMKAAGRTKWNQDDWNAMCREFSRLMAD